MAPNTKIRGCSWGGHRGVHTLFHSKMATVSKLPTDRQVLKCIYEMYLPMYPGAQSGSRGENDPYLSIDVPAVAVKLGCKPELLFGRLYCDLDYRHRYQQDDGVKVPLFTLQHGEKRHAVNFPYLAAILAGHARPTKYGES